jgi:hypothetical protein
MSAGDRLHKVAPVEITERLMMLAPFDILVAGHISYHWLIARR